MEGAVKLAVPLCVKLKSGHNWSQMRDLVIEEEVDEA